MQEKMSSVCANNSLIIAFVIRYLESTIASLVSCISVTDETGLSLALLEIIKTDCVMLRPQKEPVQGEANNIVCVTCQISHHHGHCSYQT